MAASEPDSCDAEGPPSLQEVQPEAPPPGDLPMMLPPGGQVSTTSGGAFGGVALQINDQSSGGDVLLDGVSIKASADLAMGIAQHLNESLRCVVQHSIEGQTARLYNDLQTSVDSLRAIVEGVKESIEGASLVSSSSEASKCSTARTPLASSLSSSRLTHSLQNSSIDSSGGRSSRALGQSAGHPASASDCKKPPKHKVVRLEGEKRRSKTREAQLSGLHEMSHSKVSERSMVGMTPGGVSSIKMERMTMKYLESRLVTDLFNANLIAKPQSKDERAAKRQTSKPNSIKQKLLSFVSPVTSVNLRPASSSSRVRPTLLTDRRVSQPSGIEHDSSDECFSICPNVVQEMDKDAQNVDERRGVGASSSSKQRPSHVLDCGINRASGVARDASDDSILVSHNKLQEMDDDMLALRKGSDEQENVGDEADDEGGKDQEADTPEPPSPDKRSQDIPCSPSPAPSISSPCKSASRKSRRTLSLRKDRQEQLTKTLNKKKKYMPAEGSPPDEHSGESADISELPWVQSCFQRVGYTLIKVLSCASRTKGETSVTRPAAIVFQVLVLATALLTFVRSLQQAGFVHWSEETTAESETSLSLFSDLALAMGAILGLLASGHLQLFTAQSDFELVLNNFAKQRSFETDWMQRSCWDAYMCLACWVLATLERTRAVLASRQGSEASTLEMGLTIASFALSSFLLMSQLFLVLRICRGLQVMLDDFSFSVTNSTNLKLAEQDWNVLQALLRNGCASLQFLFVVLQSTIVAAVTLAVADILSDQGRAIELLAGGIILVGLAQMFLQASAVTDHCGRLPAFVNSLHFGRDHDPDRMYLVEYMVYSQAGFYIFEVRLTSDLVMKFVYIICMALFGVTTKVITSV